MTSFFQKLFSRYPVKTRRLLEILPGLVSWSLIFFPIWGSLVIPYAVAYFIIFYDIYWFYKSFSLVITASLGTNKIQIAEKTNWLEKAKKEENYNKLTHVLIIPQYGESIPKLRETIEAIVRQTMPTKKIFVVLAMEQREKAAKERAEVLISEYKNKFGKIFATFHPDIEGEVKGKSSNEAFAGKETYRELVEKGLIDLDYATISSVDADSIFDKQYFAYLGYKFLSDEKRYNKFWQSAGVFYNNFWTIPAPIRVVSFFGSLWRIGVLVQGDRLVTHSTYSLSFKMLKEIGFWDVDVIPEDYRVFYKAFYMLKGKLWVEPLFLKTSMDSPLSKTYWGSLKNKYQQEQRWSWGVSDNPIFIKWWLTVPGVPFFRKTMMLYTVLLDHFLWPVNWFIITIAANIIPLINPVFSRTSLGYNLPRLAGFILTSCLFALLAMIVIDFKNRPKNYKTSRARQFLFPLEFMLLPVAGLFLSTIPALVSHTKLLLGKRMEYKVTEKV
jgi:cellulose synthase/poly-beta-1,6-N-acetylglucosamine synthase-like glycosyltransferase